MKVLCVASETSGFGVLLYSSCEGPDAASCKGRWDFGADCTQFGDELLPRSMWIPCVQSENHAFKVEDNAFGHKKIWVYPVQGVPCHLAFTLPLCLLKQNKSVCPLHIWLVKILQMSYLCHICLWFSLYHGTYGMPNEEFVTGNSQDKVFQRKEGIRNQHWAITGGFSSLKKKFHNPVTCSWLYALRSDLLFTPCSFLAGELCIVFIKRFFAFCYLYYSRTAGSRGRMNWSLFVLS